MLTAVLSRRIETFISSNAKIKHKMQILSKCSSKNCIYFLLISKTNSTNTKLHNSPSGLILNTKTGTILSKTDKGNVTCGWNKPAVNSHFSSLLHLWSQKKFTNPQCLNKNSLLTLSTRYIWYNTCERTRYRGSKKNFQILGYVTILAGNFSLMATVVIRRFSRAICA